MNNILPNKALAERLFLQNYHHPYPQNIKDVRDFVSGFEKYCTSKPAKSHFNAMLHFLNVLQEGESGFVYGMLVRAWEKMIESLYSTRK